MNVFRNANFFIMYWQNSGSTHTSSTSLGVYRMWNPFLIPSTNITRNRYDNAVFKFCTCAKLGQRWNKWKKVKWNKNESFSKRDSWLCTCFSWLVQAFEDVLFTRFYSDSVLVCLLICNFIKCSHSLSFTQIKGNWHLSK